MLNPFSPSPSCPTLKPHDGKTQALVACLATINQVRGDSSASPHADDGRSTPFISSPA